MPGWGLVVSALDPKTPEAQVPLAQSRAITAALAGTPSASLLQSGETIPEGCDAVSFLARSKPAAATVAHRVYLYEWPGTEGLTAAQQSALDEGKLDELLGLATFTDLGNVTFAAGTDQITAKSLTGVSLQTGFLMKLYALHRDATNEPLGAQAKALAGQISVTTLMGQFNLDPSGVTPLVKAAGSWPNGVQEPLATVVICGMVQIL